MLLHFLNRKRLPRWYLLVVAMAVAAAPGFPVHAAAIASVTDCSASGDGLRCYLGGVLKFLYVAAGVLVVLLVGVVAMAIKTYRKNKDNKELS